MAECFYGTPAHTSRRKTAFFVIRGHRAKTLKTISEQVSLLSSRGVEIDDLIDEMGFEAKEKEA